MVTVYSKPACVQCTATYRALEEKGIPYTVEDLTDPSNAERLETFRDKGFLQAPIVEATGHPKPGDGLLWSGFRPDLIATL